jgi:hypothetical protein
MEKNNVSGQTLESPTLSTNVGDKIDENTFFHDESVEVDFSNSTTGNLINNFLEYFKKKTNKSKNFNMVVGIDNNDPISTNLVLEEFYYEMMKYKEGSEEFIRVLKYKDMDRLMTSGDELYGILKNGEPLLVSQSLFSILQEFTEMKKFIKKKVVVEIVNLK